MNKYLLSGIAAIGLTCLNTTSYGGDIFADADALGPNNTKVPLVLRVDKSGKAEMFEAKGLEDKVNALKAAEAKGDIATKTKLEEELVRAADDSAAKNAAVVSSSVEDLMKTDKDKPTPACYSRRYGRWASYSYSSWDFDYVYIPRRVYTYVSYSYSYSYRYSYSISWRTWSSGYSYCWYL